MGLTPTEADGTGHGKNSSWSWWAVCSILVSGLALAWLLVWLFGYAFDRGRLTFQYCHEEASPGLRLALEHWKASVDELDRPFTLEDGPNWLGALGLEHRVEFAGIADKLLNQTISGHLILMDQAKIFPGEFGPKSSLSTWWTWLRHVFSVSTAAKILLLACLYCTAAYLIGITVWFLTVVGKRRQEPSQSGYGEAGQATLEVGGVVFTFAVLAILLPAALLLLRQFLQWLVRTVDPQMTFALIWYVVDKIGWLIHQVVNLVLGLPALVVSPLILPLHALMLWLVECLS